MNTIIKQLDNSTITIAQPELDPLASALRGELLSPAHADYQQARQVWNGMIDKRPALIVRCSGCADVITAVRFAKQHKLLLSVKGGGHNIGGSAVCEGGLMIDLSAMRSVQVDPQNQRALVEGGALLGDVDHETQCHGLAVPLGINSTTGVGGLALGGGYGWLSRAFGHTVDNILSADIVTADGEFLHLSEQQNPELFWAIRGGSGNFGIVTRFEFQLHPVGPMLLSGPVIFPIEQAQEVLKNYREIAPQLPDQASCWFVVRKAPPFPFLDQRHHGQPVLILAMSYCGDLASGEQALAPLRQLGQPLADAVAPHPYTGWQAAFDPLLTAGAHNYWKSSDFLQLPDGLIDMISAAALSLPSDDCEIFVAQLGGAAGRVAPDAMAYPHRSSCYTMNIHGRWPSAALDERCISWVREQHVHAEEYATGSVYVNFVPENNEPRKVGPYGANKARLEKIKAQVDPDNLFRCNINIQTTSKGAA
ncbi:FAD-binding oxidoreductase [Dasania marina]|uniref:FAD-binding oxidoreductase n=1 Tax=Dasania marina TaxID=471499 RepID=UPI0003775B4C|nr:FAD-binding oxidoreductase [Dasania marina]